MTNDGNVPTPELAQKVAGKLQRELIDQGVNSSISGIMGLTDGEVSAVEGWLGDGAYEVHRPKCIKDWPRAVQLVDDPNPEISAKTQTLLARQVDDIVAHNRIVRVAHDEWVEAKETLSEVRKMYEAHQKTLSSMVDDLEKIKKGERLLPFGDPHPDVEAGKGKPEGTPALDETAKGHKPKGKKKAAAKPKPKPDAPTDPDEERECVNCSLSYKSIASDERGGCPNCGTTAYTHPTLTAPPKG